MQGEGLMADTYAPAKATFAPIGRNNQPEAARALTVHFNPATLQYEVANTLAPTRSGASTQYVSKSTAKLSMELTFDGTLTGVDVRQDTHKLAQFMEPRGTGKNAVPAVVEFAWGSFLFRGMVDAFRETFTFFSDTGVPLRSTVSLSLSRQEQVFDTQAAAGGASPSPAFSPSAVQAGGAPRLANAQSPAGSAGDLAARAGDARAARALGAANGQESLRFSTGGDGLVVSGDVQLRGPAAFATGSAGAGAGAGLSLGAGASADAGTGFSAGAGFSANVAASASAGASAGVSAGASGTFAELRVQGPQVSVNLSPEKLLPTPPGVSLAAGAGASFGLGGQASVQGGASLRADVGAGASLKGKITFGE